MSDPCVFGQAVALHSWCPECRHLLAVHTADQRCTLCAMEARQVEMEARFIDEIGDLRDEMLRRTQNVPRLIGQTSGNPPIRSHMETIGQDEGTLRIGGITVPIPAREMPIPQPIPLSDDWMQERYGVSLEDLGTTELPTSIHEAGA